MRQPIQIAIYPLRIVNGLREYMLFHRTPQAGNFWQGITGGSEDDETPMQTALRELLEETGISGVTLHPFGEPKEFLAPESMKHHFNAKITTLTEHSFYIILNEETVPLLDGVEHDQWRWVNLEEALTLLHWPNNKESLKHCDLIIEKL